MPLPKIALLALLAACGTDKAGPGDGLVDDSDPTAAGDDTAPDDSVAPSLTCGDGALDAGEACDEGDQNGAEPCGCQTDCQLAAAATACDDGSLCTEADACDGAGACLGVALSCDDGDACTTDACDEETGACQNTGFEGAAVDLFDMALLKDPDTLEVELLDTETTWEGAVRVEVSHIRYTSYEHEGCERRPIRIDAFLAQPQGESGLPGLVVAHGLGGQAYSGNASTPAGQLGVVALAYSGPGQGESEGTGSTPDHLFDDLTDPRASWFWEHAAAAIRGLTVLESWPTVDPSRLGMTGYSGGGVATLTVNGVDDRVKVAMPVSATGHLDLAIEATPNPGWEADLLASMTPPRDPDSAEWAAFEQWLDPKNYLATAHGATLIVDGTQDEFFPLNAAVATLDDLRAGSAEHRILHIPNWDHGWFALYTGESAAALTEDDLIWWFARGFGTDTDLAELAPMPSVTDVAPWTCVHPDYWWVTWSCALVTAGLDAPTGYDVDDVVFWWSADGALTWQSWNLNYNADFDLWYAEVGTLDAAVYDASNLAWFVSFGFQDGSFGQEFTLSSAANIPPGFSPYIVPIEGPIP